MTDAVTSKASTATAASRNKWIILIVVGVLSLAADQASKIWARHSLPTTTNMKTGGACDVPYDIAARACYGKPVAVIDGYWDWELSMNLGSAFSMFAGQGSARVMLSIVGLLACAGMIWMLKRSRDDQKILHWALALVVGGAIGNLIDRIYFGSVTDFVLWRWKTHRWPVFNIADVVLVVGVGLMFIDIIKEGKREKQLAKAKAAA
ncbi:MAG TPA: signal peptidase II [Kofleriaceae bacterium]|nr:signal peptidase II [Kofleriaceae bacterium]